VEVRFISCYLNLMVLLPFLSSDFDVSYGAGSHCDTGSITISTSSGYQTCGTTQNSSTLVGYSGAQIAPVFISCFTLFYHVIC
jgi:hypothetical protein